MSLRIPRNWDFGAFRAETAKIARSKSVMPAEASPAAPHTSFRRAMEKPLKTGWLKKQRSIVKNWQLRYFVLRGNVLTYYKDERETAVQGTIPLFSCQVNELPSSTDDKFLFEITPGGGSDRERDVLMASSQSDLDDWVRSIRKIIGSRSSGVFGKSLAEVMMYEGKSGSGLVPVLVEKCADFIRERGLSEEGVFRLPGQDNQVKHFREAFDAGERPSFPSDTDVHTVASLLKLYLRELPEPVVPWSQYQDFLDSSLTLDVTTATGKDKLERQITLLPKVNYNLLSYICRFLFQVQQHSQVNKMSVENLATVMGVNLFKPQVEDAISMMKGTPLIQKVMTGMIRHHELLFPPLKEMPQPLSHLPSADSRSKEAGNPRNLVGWECAETPISTPQPSLQFAQPSEASSPSAGAEQEQGTTAKEESWSPRKRTRTLPSISCPAGIIAREPSWERWSRIQENIDQSDEKTWSDDIFKLLDLQKVTLFSESEEEKRECEEAEEEDEEPAAAPTHTTDISISHSESVKPQPDALLTNHTPADDTQLRTINRLQQENEELGAAVAELRAALEAERRSRAALEVLLSNAEKSRDEAVTESEKLSRRMEAFFSTSSSSGQSPYFH